jgi:hypothetical protein
MYPGEIKFHLLCVSRLWWSLAIKSHMKPYSVVTGLGTELVHWLMKITSKEKQNCRFVSSITKFVHIHSVCVGLVLKLAQCFMSNCQSSHFPLENLDWSNSCKGNIAKKKKKSY